MSNELRDYLSDMIYELVLNSGAADTIEKIGPLSYNSHNYVHGWKNGQRVNLVVWCDNDAGEWRIEHRETDK